MIKHFINRLSKLQKLTCLFLVIIVLLCIFAIPSLARFINRSSILTSPVWDGTVATSYHSGSGTLQDPYIIANGEELAYFANQLAVNNYQDTYFSLKNDISLNKGNFAYDSNQGCIYNINGETYYIKKYTNEYYSNVERTGTKAGTINTFIGLNGFKGTFLGSSFTIYGLYMTSENVDEMALFTNLQGNISDLYVQNALIYGGGIASGIASTTTGSTLENVLFDGQVIGDLTYEKVDSNVLSNVDITLNNEQISQNINLINLTDIPSADIMSTTLTGTYTVNSQLSNNIETTINGTRISNGSFSVSLGNNILPSVQVIVNSDSDASISLSNLSYNINYKYGVSGGIAGIANQSTFNNVISKGLISSLHTSGGIIGIIDGGSTIRQSYNLANINSERIGAGLIGIIKNSDNSVIVEKSYNNSTILSTNTAGIIGKIANNSSNIDINNVFDTSPNGNAINTIIDTVVNVNNSYFTSNDNAIGSGNTTGQFTSTTITNLEDTTFQKNNLQFTEFVNKEDILINPSNTWILIDSILPVSYIDDSSYSLISINTNFKSWNNLSDELNTLPLNIGFSFTITPSIPTMEFDSLYYCIVSSNNTLEPNEMEWLPYGEKVDITSDGSYIIYAKAIDMDDNITYINSDIIELELLEINLNEYSWATRKTSLGAVYINNPSDIKLIYDDNLININSIKYYISNTPLDNASLNGVNWLNYEGNITINEIGTYIIYCQIIDKENNVNYINTDYIAFEGYNQNEIIIGRNLNSYSNTNYITDKSMVTLRFSYVSNHLYSNEYTHNLISNILLPEGTRIKLFDNNSNSVYEYEINTSNDIYNYNNSCNANDNSCTKVATYPLTLFKKVGLGDISEYYVENTNISEVSENYTVVIDFSNTSISTNYENVSIYMQINNSDNKGIISTIENTRKLFSVYKTIDDNDTNASIYLRSSNQTKTVTNNISVNKVNITTGINYKSINNKTVIDTNYEDKIIGLMLKIVDSNNTMISRENIKNFVFKIGNQEYYPSNDNYVYINLNNSINETNDELSIIIYETSSTLTPGDYTAIINNYVSYNGESVAEIINNEISIPIEIDNNNTNNSYRFNVKEINNKYIINKSETLNSFNFNIVLTGEFNDPNVRISLYKKDVLTAYNQDYTLVNLKDYCSNEMIEHGTNIYDIDAMLYNNFQIDLISNSFDNTGYKLLFELYDDNIKISNIEKYFIAK